MPTGKSFFSQQLKPPKPAKPAKAERAPRTRGSNAPKGDTRTRIIAAAREAFSTMGFEGASLRSVAKEAGAPHQLATYY